MAHVRKQLNALNAILGPIDIPESKSAAFTLQYPVGGTGTLVVEACAQGMDQTVAGNWYALKLKKNDDTTVDNLAAAGVGSGECWAFGAIRARMSVAGDCTPTLAIAG
jgi:hypothetical protein